MDKVIEIPKNPCFICKKREATRLCDFVIDYIWTTMKDENGRMIGHMHDTCDMPLCEFCAYKTGHLIFAHTMQIC
ncbi:hypothetical protein SAMN04489735_101733 [Aneurinibacillus thermoaerophilus]|uniref:Uncharacterized protein n=1 Tax=Aneurinibacillus thermoaerophilus TaxID=143495 RepID=A0A1G8APS2_ANETH|nr:hypothetical protein SAMN04489735_101733 [Aneurinibacillus thermoaerophilus]